MTDLDRLRRLLGDPELAWLIGRVRKRLELGKPLDGPVTLTGATPAQRSAVQRLLGRTPRPGAALTVSLPAQLTTIGGVAATSIARMPSST